MYLLAGTDRPKIARALRRLRDRFDAQATDALSAIDTGAADATAACNAFALFGGARLVIVTDAERWKADDAKVVTAYASDPAPGAVLALVAGELRKDAALIKAVAKVGEVLQFDVVKRDLPRWLAEQFKLAEAKAEPGACRALIELVGDNLDELATEVDKLAAWAAGDTITDADVHRLAAGRAETSIFALTDAWGRRDVAGALRACEELLERGQGTRRDELPRLVGMLGSHVDRVRRCRDAAAEGRRSRDIATEWKRSPFYVDKLFAQAENFSADELRDAVVRLAELDHALKGGSRLAGDLELQRALIDLTRRRESARSRAA